MQNENVKEEKNQQSRIKKENEKIIIWSTSWKKQKNDLEMH